MSQLRPVQPADASTISSWATTTTEVAQWCGLTELPVPPEAIRRWSADPTLRAFVLVDDDRPVGYGELWVDDEESEVELAHLIVDPARRRQGLGRTLVTRLTGLARAIHPEVFLRVHPDNSAALACYAAAGCVRVPKPLEDEWNTAQPVHYVWLTAAES